MENTFKIPEGFELRQTGPTTFEIVPKTNIQNVSQFGQRINLEHTPEYLQEHYDYEPDYYPYDERINDSDICTPGNYNDMITQQRAHFVSTVANGKLYDYTPDETPVGDTGDMFSGDPMHELYKSGKIRLSRDERQLLEFCHNTDMKKFLREEVGKKPIKLDGDADGNFWVVK